MAVDDQVQKQWAELLKGKDVVIFVKERGKSSLRNYWGTILGIEPGNRICYCNEIAELAFLPFWTKSAGILFMFDKHNGHIYYKDEAVLDDYNWSNSEDGAQPKLLHGAVYNSLPPHTEH